MLTALFINTRYQSLRLSQFRVHPISFPLYFLYYKERHCVTGFESRKKNPHVSCYTGRQVIRLERVTAGYVAMCSRRAFLVENLKETIDAKKAQEKVRAVPSEVFRIERTFSPW